MVANVRRNDRVVTSGGIKGKVTRVQDNDVEVEIAEGVRITVVKSTLADVQSKGEPVANDES
jgi:preprotein translocase subunit YajC